MVLLRQFQSFILPFTPELFWETRIVNRILVIQVIMSVITHNSKAHQAEVHVKLSTGLLFSKLRYAASLFKSLIGNITQC